jgi:transcriptional regulator with XRE-family HTH domain
MNLERSPVSGEILRVAREAADITLSAMAARTNFTIGHLSNVEAGRRTASALLVAAYERELGVPVDRRSFLVLPTVLSQTASNAERLFSHVESDAARAERVADLVDSRGRRCVVRSSAEMLPVLVADFDGISLLTERTRSPRLQTQLYRSAALTAALTADALMVMGDMNNAHAWNRVATKAADEAGDDGVAATVAGLGALISLYGGDLDQTVIRARACTSLAGDRPQPTAAMARTIEALALSRLGDGAAARTALARAEASLAALGDTGGDSVFGFTERRFLFYSGRTLLHLGDLKGAGDAQDAALALYPSTSVGDPTLIRLDRARLIARSGDVDEACAYALHVLKAVPDGRRAMIYLDYGRNLVEDAVSPENRSQPAVRDYLDTLEALRRDFA